MRLQLKSLIDMKKKQTKGENLPKKQGPDAIRIILIVKMYGETKRLFSLQIFWKHVIKVVQNLRQQFDTKYVKLKKRS